MFDRCCENHTPITYQIVHNPKPINFSDKMDEIIKKLLWYVPNIDSFQAEKNELIEDSLYDDFSFTYIMNEMGMDEAKDVKWIEPSDSFDENDWMFFENSICNQCQKIILTRQKNLSKTNDLLRCLRNCIAHGHFSVIDDYIIGFNKHTTKSNPEGIKKAVIKIKPNLLLKAIKTLSSPIGKEKLLVYAFKRIGYNVIQEPGNANVFDMIIERDETQYVVELKQFRGKKYLHPEDLKLFLSKSLELLPNTERILFIDTSRVTKDVRKLESEINNFRIIDIAQIKELLKDPPIDILSNQ